MLPRIGQDAGLMLGRDKPAGSALVRHYHPFADGRVRAAHDAAGLGRSAKLVDHVPGYGMRVRLAHDAKCVNFTRMVKIFLANHARASFDIHSMMN